MKVAMLTDCYPPRLGGIESQVRDLSRQLVRAGHEVEVFTATVGAHGERGGSTSTGDDGVTVHRHAIRLPAGIPVNPFARPEVRRRLAAGGFDVAHAHLGVVSPFATELVPLALGTATLFFTVLTGLVVRDALPVVLLASYGLLSGIAFLLYRSDKSAAEQGRRRTPEATLHLVDMMGGWPGAMIARQAFRHKTIKQPFRTVFWVTVLANCVTLAWFVSGAPQMLL